MDLLSPIYQAPLTMFCVSYSRWRTAIATLDKEGHVIAGPRSGSPRPHPALREKREAAQAIQSFCERFGMTPGSRARLGIKDPPRTTVPGLREFAAGETGKSQSRYFPDGTMAGSEQSRTRFSAPSARPRNPIPFLGMRRDLAFRPGRLPLVPHLRNDS